MTSRLRAERLYFWPDPRNTTARQLAELLAGRDPGTLTAEGFHRASAAVQGLPALERLLFDEGATAAFRSERDEVRRRCEVLETITRNIGEITADVAREWSVGDTAYRRRIETAGSGNPAYADPKEATQDFLKSLHGALERVASLKLAKPLGTSLATARPMLTEEWRSGRTLRDVRLNLCVRPGPLPGGRGIRPERLRPGGRAGPRDRRPDPPRLRRVHRRGRQDSGPARAGGQEPARAPRRRAAPEGRQGPPAPCGRAADDRPRPPPRVQRARWRLTRWVRAAGSFWSGSRRWWAPPAAGARRGWRAALPERSQRRGRSPLRERLRPDGRGPVRPDDRRTRSRLRRASPATGGRALLTAAGSGGARHRPRPAGGSGRRSSTRAIGSSPGMASTRATGRCSSPPRRRARTAAGSWARMTRPGTTGAWASFPRTGSARTR